MTIPEPIRHVMAETFLHVSTELRRESDRGCVVLAFAWMDDELTRILKRYCLPSVHSASHADELFGIGRPVGDAATKIDLAFRLALLRPETYRSLHLFRRLRNDFAHLSTKLSFETDSVKNRVLAIFDLQKNILSAMWQDVSAIEDIKEYLADHHGKTPIQALSDFLGARQVFELTAATVVSGLVLTFNQVTPVETLEKSPKV